MTVLILAGGFGSRMRHLFGDTPKSLIPVGKRPFILWQLDHLAAAGYTKAVISLGYGRDAIRAAVKEPPLKVAWDAKHDFPLGTAAQLVRALPMLPEVFAVTYGDCLVPMDHRAAWASYTTCRYQACMTVCQSPDHAGNVLVADGRVRKYDDGPDARLPWFDAGLILVRKTCFSLASFRRLWRETSLETNSARHPVYLSLTDVWPALATEGHLGGYCYRGEPPCEIGSESGYNRTIEYLRKQAENVPCR